jgi:hypothetical protein
MDILDRSDDEAEVQSRCANSSRLGSRFGKRRAKRRSGSEQHLPLMDCVGSSDNGDGVEEEALPLPDYERLSQSARLPDDPDSKDPPPPLTPVQQQQTPVAKREASSPPQPPPTQQQKPAAWRLLEYVRNRHKAGGGGATSGCGVGSDGDSKSSDGERESEDGGKEGKDKKKKRSSWLPDPDRRWPVQGFY